jgi:hypothetical protein
VLGENILLRTPFSITLNVCCTIWLYSLEKFCELYPIIKLTKQIRR